MRLSNKQRLSSRYRGSFGETESQKNERVQIHIDTGFVSEDDKLVSISAFCGGGGRH